MTAVAEAPVFTGAGVYANLPEDVYHADPVPGGSLSSSGAKALIAPSCPAIFKYEQDHPVHKDEFDLGAAAHMLVLGAGPEIIVVDADNWMTKAAKADRQTARAAGQIPLLAKDYDVVQEMATELRNHPDAATVFDPFGAAEQSMFWQDEETGVWCRGRVDWLAADLQDYKTTTDVSPGAIRNTIAKLHYHQQADWYLTGAVQLGLVAPDAAFRFVFQRKTPPFLVSVVELDEEALQIGRDRNRRALEIFRDCTDSGVWPDYGDGIDVVSLPRWAVREHMEGNY